jgi:hypothetical protein
MGIDTCVRQEREMKRKLGTFVPLGRDTALRLRDRLWFSSEERISNWLLANVHRRLDRSHGVCQGVLSSLFLLEIETERKEFANATQSIDT